jgi:predicted ABC-type transport system involved in lysophospholipase L1 biosynthesis ATPase subunit
MTDDNALLVELVAVTKSYEAPDGAPPVPVLREASFQVRRGERVAIVGPSGSGKSTILNLLGTLDQPDSGQVRLLGQNLSSLQPDELATFRNRSIGFVFQSHHLLPHCSVLENVLIPTMASTGKVPDGAAGRAMALLKRVGLGARLDYLPGRLSGGERQRCALVRALINQPAVLLADEPTGALDRASAEEVARLLVELNQEQGVTLILVTHSQELAGRMQRSVEVRDGKLI